MRKKTVALILALSMILCLWGCSSKESENGTSETKTDKEGVTAFVGGNIFEESLDPIKGAMSHGYPFVCNALLKVDPKSEYVGDLAEDWDISDDALTYTFYLRQGIKFSDGSDFTADDVVFTYEEVKENQANNENVDLTRLQSITAKDDYTVVFQLKERYSPFFDTAAKLQIVPSDAYDSDLFDKSPIGTGSWKVAQYDTNQQIILTANESSFEGVPSINQVTLVNMDNDAAFAAAQSGQLDIVMVGAGYANEQVANMTIAPFETMDVRNISLPVSPEHTVTTDDGMTLKVGNNVTCDKAVREALSIGINRSQIIDHALNGVGVPAVNFTDNLVWASSTTFEDNRVEEAKEILENAGWVDSDGDGIREKDGLKCSFDVYAASGDEERYQLAAALSQNAIDLGIQINAKNNTWDEIGKLEYSQGVVWGWGQYSPTALDSLFATDAFMRGIFDNVVEFSNPQVDEKIKEAYDASNQEDAIRAWKEVQELANSEYPYLYIVNIEHCYFINNDLDISMETQIPHPHGHGSPIICNMKDWTWK